MAGQLTLETPGAVGYMYENFFSAARGQAIQHYGAKNVADLYSHRGMRAMHAELRSRLGVESFADLSWDRRREFLSEMQKVFLEFSHPDMHMNMSADEKRAAFETHRAQFPTSAFNGYAFNSEWANQVAYGFRDNLNKGQLPISPYDPLWQDRESLIAAGGNDYYISASDIEAIAGDDLRDLGGRAATMYEAGTVLQRLDGSGDSIPAVTEADVIGLTALRPYMSDDEYPTAADKLSVDYHENLDAAMSPEAIAKAVEIVTALDAQGNDYTIEPDRGRGQMRITLKDTGVQVRIMDTRDNEGYIGRVYRDGYVVRASKKVGSDYEPVSLDAAGTMTLVNVALGKEARDDAGNILGQSYEGGRGRMDPYFVRGADRGVRLPYRLADGGVATVMIQSQRTAAGGKFYREDHEDMVEQARADLKEMITDAQNTFVTELGIQELIREFEAHKDEAIEGEYEPQYSSYPEIAALQEAYWSVLTGETEALLRPGYSEKDYSDQLYTEDEEAERPYTVNAADMRIEGEPEAMIYEHARLAAEDFIGQYDLHETVMPDTGEARQVRFNPVRVAQYSAGTTSMQMQMNNLIAAVRVIPEIHDNEYLGTDAQTKIVRDRAISFGRVKPDEEYTSAQLRQKQELTEHIRNTIERNGGVNVVVEFDDNGVVHWSADRYLGNRERQLYGKSDPMEPSITGTIGQIFLQGEHGEVTTSFASGEDYMFVPGYKATIISQGVQGYQSMEERTRLKGYEQMLKEAISAQITSDMVSENTHTGDPTSLNSVYRRLYDRRFDVNFLEHSESYGMPRDLAELILRTESQRVRYGNEFSSGSTIYQDLIASQFNEGPNDLQRSPWMLTGKRNMAVLSEESDGYFDGILTSTGTNQGIVRYLVDSAEVTEDGRIIRGELDDTTAMRKHPVFADMQYDPADRQVMTYMNVLNSSGLAQKTKTAMMTVGGWNMDDGFVVSQEFAAKTLVQTPEGTRPLRVGDKISDLHGNKGVISVIVDVTKDYEGNELMQRLRDVFYDNPNLDVVMSPFSVVSRRNGGTTREAGRNATSLYLDGEEYAESLGEMTILVTHKDVDSGTNIYDDEALAEGRGRKASGQLAWSLMSLGADDLLEKFFAGNSSSVENTRELMYLVGLDMSDTGELSLAGESGTSSGRHVFYLPESDDDVLGKPDKNGIRRVVARKASQSFEQTIEGQGGELALPFPLAYPDRSGVVGKGRQMPQAEDGTYRLPVLSSYLRSGRELDDGSVISHDYTRSYGTIYAEAVRWKHLENVLEGMADKNSPVAADIKREQAVAQLRAQKAYDSIASDVIARKFESKKNMFRNTIMGKKQPHSATAVWTPNAELDIDEVGVSPRMAEALGLKNGDYAAVFRDPQLRAGGFRGLRVKIMDRDITGVAVNPVATKSFDGDFDGDSVGVIALHDERSQRVLREKCSVAANLLDLGYKSDDGLYDLSFHTSQDVAMGMTEALKNDLATLRGKANELYEAKQAGQMDDGQFYDASRVLTAQLSAWTHECLQNSHGTVVLNFSEDKEKHREPIVTFVEKGAKGSMSGLAAYEEYREGMTEERRRALNKESNVATAVKSHGTGSAGAYSQRGILAMRGAGGEYTTQECVQAITELIYPVTQAILQAKHDAADAKRRYININTTVRAHFQGIELDDDMQPIRGEAALPMTPEAWVEQTKRVLGPDCLDVKVDEKHIKVVADILTDPYIGMVRSMEDPSVIRDYGTTLDRCAYSSTVRDGSNFAAAYEMAEEGGHNLFDGPMKAFAPTVVRKNTELAHEPLVIQEEQMRSLQQRDVTGESREVKTPQDMREVSAVRSEASVEERKLKAAQETESVAQRLQNMGFSIDNGEKKKTADIGLEF